MNKNLAFLAKFNGQTDTEVWRKYDGTTGQSWNIGCFVTEHLTG